MGCKKNKNSEGEGFRFSILWILWQVFGNWFIRLLNLPSKIIP